MTKRQILINGHVYELPKVVEIKMPKKVLYIEEMADGRLRLSYSTGLINELPRLIEILSVEE